MCRSVNIVKIESQILKYVWVGASMYLSFLTPLLPRGRPHPEAPLSWRLLLLCVYGRERSSAAAASSGPSQDRLFHSFLSFFLSFFPQNDDPVHVAAIQQS